MEEVWIKPEPEDETEFEPETINGESTEYCHIKCEQEIDIADTDSFTETVIFNVQEISSETPSIIKSEIACDDYKYIPSTKNILLQSLKNNKQRIAGEPPFGCQECGKTFPRKVRIEIFLF